MADCMAELLYNYLVVNPLPGDILISVPLHPKKLRQRGYNQSGLVARELSKLSGLPVVDDCLVREQYTPPQARSANVNERRDNVIKAFTCRDSRLQGKQVLLLDDVTTSGATLIACAGALKFAGATSVWALVIAMEL